MVEAVLISLLRVRHSVVVERLKGQGKQFVLVEFLTEVQWQRLAHKPLAGLGVDEFITETSPG